MRFPRLRRRATPEPTSDHIDVAVDRNGQRYTTHAFGTAADPWHGALILTPALVRSLEDRGLLPLTEVTAAGA